MPIYPYKCEKCGSKTEIRQGMMGGIPLCCGKAMSKLPTAPTIRIKGTHSEGYKKGYQKEYLRSKGKEYWRGEIV